MNQISLTKLVAKYFQFKSDGVKFMQKLLMQIELLKKIDRLKLILRQSRIHSGERRENSTGKRIEFTWMGD